MACVDKSVNYVSVIYVNDGHKIFLPGDLYLTWIC